MKLKRVSVGIAHQNRESTTEEFYEISEVDSLIDEKDKRIAELESQLTKWHKVSEKLPKEASPVLVVYKEQVHFCFYSSEVFFDYETTEIFSFKDDIMWCERPHPPK